MLGAPQPFIRSSNNISLEEARAKFFKNYTKGSLSQELSKAGLKIHKSPSDGNCQYHSIADQLNKIGLWGQFDHLSIRKIIMAHIYSNYEFFGPFLEETALKKLKTGTWGGNVDLVACADCFNIKIVVVSSSGPEEILPRHNDSNMTRETVYLAFTRELHYDSTCEYSA